MRKTLIQTLKEGRPDLEHELRRLLDVAKGIWSEQHHLKFTAHGEPHIRQVECNLDSLAQRLSSVETPLSDQEAFVLLAACYLHDVGMQLADEKDAREKHAQYSHDLIVGREVSGASLNLDLSDRAAARAIGLVARGHWSSYALPLKEVDYLGANTQGRLRLLALLLSTADLLDVSPVRARYYLQKHRLYSLDDESELHQKLHYCVRGFKISEAVQTKELQFEVTMSGVGDQVNQMAQWLLHRLTVEWRRIEAELYRQSGGAIRWCRPWARAVIEETDDPHLSLSSAAERLLAALRADQSQVDRDRLLRDLRMRIRSGKPGVVLLNINDTGENGLWLPWFRAHAGYSYDLVATLALREADPHDLLRLSLEIASQFGFDLETHDPHCAMKKLVSEISKRNKAVAVVVDSDAFGGSILREFLEAFESQSGPDVALLVFGPEPLQNVLEPLDPLVFEIGALSQPEMKDWLSQRWGLADPEVISAFEDVAAIGGWSLSGPALRLLLTRMERDYELEQG